MNWQDKIQEVYRKWENNSEVFEIKTSGSTGRPKTIYLSKEKMARSAQMSIDFFELKKKDPVLLVLPADKIGGMMLIIRSIIGQLKLITIEPALDPFKSIDLTQKIKFCSMTPAQFASVYKRKESLRQLRKVENILLGGSTVSSEMLQKIKDEPNQYFHSYGMTETISHIAIRNLSAGEAFFNALGGVTFIKNFNGQLIIDAPILLDQPLLTNDIVELEDTTKMSWKGRLDNVVNSGGVKIIVEEVEERIRTKFDGDFYLLGIPDDVLGEKLVMISKSVPPSMIFLPKFSRPKEIYIRDVFRYTENGKLMRLPPHQLSEL